MRICNMCGKPFDRRDEFANRCLHDEVYYEGKYDCKMLHLDVCRNCFGKMLEEYIVPKAKYNPISNILEDDEDDEEYEVPSNDCSDFCGGHLPAEGLTIKEGDCTIHIYCEDAASCQGCCGQCAEF